MSISICESAVRFSSAAMASPASSASRSANTCVAAQPLSAPAAILAGARTSTAGESTIYTNTGK